MARAARPGPAQRTRQSAATRHAPLHRSHRGHGHGALFREGRAGRSWRRRAGDDPGKLPLSVRSKMARRSSNQATVAPVASSNKDYQFAPQEQPTFPGGPYMPSPPPLRRLAYAAVGLWIGATAALANASVTV